MYEVSTIRVSGWDHPLTSEGFRVDAWTHPLTRVVLTSLREVPCALHHILNIKSQILKGHVTRRRRAEAIETNHIALRSSVAIPTAAHSCFNGESGGDRRRQHLIFVV